MSGGPEAGGGFLSHSGSEAQPGNELPAVESPSDAGSPDDAMERERRELLVRLYQLAQSGDADQSSGRDRPAALDTIAEEPEEEAGPTTTDESGSRRRQSWPSGPMNESYFPEQWW